MIEEVTRSGLCGETSSQASAYLLIQSAKSAKLGCSILMLRTCWFQRIVIGVVNLSLATLTTAEAFRSDSKWWCRKVYQTSEEGRKTYKAAGIIHSGLRPLVKCEVRTHIMLRLSKPSDKFLKCLLIEVSVVRVTTDEVFCFVSYRVLQVCHFLNSWKLDFREWLTWKNCAIVATSKGRLRNGQD